MHPGTRSCTARTFGCPPSGFGIQLPVVWGFANQNVSQAIEKLVALSISGKPLLIMGLELGETRWVLLDVLAVERPAVYQQDSGRLEHAGET
jgi:hypothetical protein